MPLTPLQRAWYRRVLERDLNASGLMSYAQLTAVLTQLQKVCNHPKVLLGQHDRDAKAAEGRARAAEVKGDPL